MSSFCSNDSSMSSRRYPSLRYPSQTNISFTNAQPTTIVPPKKVCTFLHSFPSKVKSNRAPGNAISVPWITNDWNWSSVFFSPQLEEPQPPEPPSPPNIDLPPHSEPPLPQKDPLPESEYEKPNSLPPDIIHQLLVNPALYDPLRTPRYPIVLCHGAFSIHRP